MSKKLWGGRFAKKTDPSVEEFTRSIHYDYKLAEYDLLGSMIHVEILRKAGLLKNREALKLYGGLTALYQALKNGKFQASCDSEDIHTDIQNKLESKVGGLALKLHTARSRNDQVAFAARLYSKISLLELEVSICALISALNEKASANKGVIMPGFTHLQHAQPVYLADYLAAYVEMLSRDAKRLNTVFKNIRLTMGSGALAGVPVPAALYHVKAPKYLKDLKGCGGYFDVETTENSLDAVSDRDFVIEILNALAILGMHLSRLSEDLIIWSTKEFGFVELDDAFCTGSSLMPQKKNPDALELIRGNTGRLYGNLVSVLTTMKALPLAYNRDMQLDKEPLFNSVEVVQAELNVMTGLIKTIRFNRENIAAQLKDESLYATDLVYYLVGKGVPFTEAHGIIGKLIRHALDNGIEIKEMSQDDMRKFSGKFVRVEVVRLFDPKVSVESKTSVKRRT